MKKKYQLYLKRETIPFKVLKSPYNDAYRGQTGNL